MNDIIVQNNQVALFDTARFEHMQRVATAMAQAKLVPAHLQGSVADCLMVCQQADRWGMDPFAVAQATFVISGKLGYEGKLIAAVINSRARLSHRLSYELSGTGDNMKVVVSGQFEAEEDPRTVEATVGEARTDNKNWTKLPDQMLCYYGARKWGRRHAPELMLGVLSEDEIEQTFMRDITPVDTAKEGIKGTGETEPGTASGMTTGNADSETGNADSSANGRGGARKRIKLTFRGKEMSQTNFLRDIKQIAAKTDDDDEYEALLDDVDMALETIQDEADRQTVRDKVEPILDVEEEEETPMPQAKKTPMPETKGSLNLAEE